MAFAFKIEKYLCQGILFLICNKSINNTAVSQGKRPGILSKGIPEDTTGRSQLYHLSAPIGEPTAQLWHTG